MSSSAPSLEPSAEWQRLSADLKNLLSDKMRLREPLKEEMTPARPIEQIADDVVLFASGQMRIMRIVTPRALLEWLGGGV